MAKRLVVALEVLQRLAERIVQVQPVLVVEVGRRQRAQHGRDLLGAEVEGLEVGQAPPRLAQRRGQRDAAQIGLHAVGLPPHRLQHMAQAQPQARLVGMALQQALIGGGAALIVPDRGQDGGVEAEMGGVVGLDLEQALDLDQGLGRLVVPVQHPGIGAPRRDEAGRQLQATLQHGLGLAVAAEPGAHLGQHPQGRDVGGMGAQARAQQALGQVQFVAVQRVTGAHQLGIVHPGLDVTHIGHASAGGIAGLAQQVAKRAPHPRAPRLQPGEVLGLGDLQDQPRFRLAGDRGQDLARLGRGQVRAAAQKPPCMCDRSGHGAHRGPGRRTCS